MEIRANTTADWAPVPGETARSTVALEIDLTVSAIDPAQLQHQLQRFFADTVFPGLIPEDVPTAPHLRTEAKTELSGDWVHDAQGFHERISVLIDLRSTAPITPEAAFSHVRGNIAQAIADHVAHCLQLNTLRI